jgi:hypothetical protein
LLLSCYDEALDSNSASAHLNLQQTSQDNQKPLSNNMAGTKQNRNPQDANAGELLLLPTC